MPLALFPAPPPAPAAACMLALLIAPATITPLTQQQQTALETAFDGRDYREAAFDALVENVRSWTPDANGGETVPQREALLAAPDEHRGAIYPISGVLRQQRRLPKPYEHVQEWFVGEIDRAMLVYVVDAAESTGFRDGETVSIAARFYKRATFTARDGQVRDYPAFVGAFPEVLPGVQRSSGSSAVPWFLIPLIAVMVMVFAYLMMRVRRPTDRIASQRLPRESSSVEAEVVDLPDDPAGALAELKRRAEAVDR